MTVREATQQDFGSIYQLLYKLNHTSLSEDDWNNITQKQFVKSRSYGYVLVKNVEILGFIGTIFSERRVVGQSIEYCNIHSWIVNPKAKMGGLSLLAKVLKLKKCVITNFTASEEPYKIFKKIGFEEIDYSNYKLLAFQSLKFIFNVEINLIDDKNFQSILNSKETKLYQDHCKFKNVQFLHVKNKSSKSLIIIKKKVYAPSLLEKNQRVSRVFQNKLFLAEIHYVDNPDLFFALFCSSNIAFRICKKLGVLGIICSDRYIPSNINLKKSFYPSKRPILYKTIFSDAIIDTLYSELFILNL